MSPTLCFIIIQLQEEVQAALFSMLKTPEVSIKGLTTTSAFATQFSLKIQQPTVEPS